MKNIKLSVVSKALLIVAALLLVVSLFVPIWSIYLDAPQYPEGLSLQIWANAIAGDVDIINGLNHYIGMKTLHTEDFIEFKILPYIISAFALLFAAAALVGRKKLLYFSFWAFVVFGIVSMVDFWLWEYDYGHNLDPTAAIIVPGMAYQPPLIGFKQLLNFGAFSIPDIGGWLFIGAGLLVLTAVFKESGFLKKFSKNKKGSLSALALLFFISSCANEGPEPISLNKDACASCKMSISEGNFAAEIITTKGRIYKFDDLLCMLGYSDENSDIEIGKYYVGDHAKDNELIDASAAWYVQNEAIKSPMGGHTAAFAEKENAEKLAATYNTEVKNWTEIKSATASNPNHDHVH